MGHAVLRFAQPFSSDLLLHGEDCQWYHPHVRNAEHKTSGKAAPLAGILGGEYELQNAPVQRGTVRE